MENISKIFEKYSHVEEEEIFQNELLEKEFTVLNSNVEKIAKEIITNYNEWILKGYVPNSTILEIIGTEDVMNDFISNCL